MNTAIASIDEWGSKPVIREGVTQDGLDRAGFKTRIYIEFVQRAPLQIRIKHPNVKIRPHSSYPSVVDL